MIRAMIFLIVAVFSVSTVTADTAEIRVSGEAVLQVAPDKATIPVGVVAEGETAQQALTKNSQIVEAVIQALVSAGVKREQITTRDFSVQPLWSNRPRNAEDNWRSEIIGYRVNNGLSVETQALTKVGEWIAIATQHGANQVQSVEFDLQDRRRYRAQAIKQAVSHAKADAQAAAEASGLSIASVKQLTVQTPEASIVRVEQPPLMRAMAADVNAPPIDGGDITVRAIVNVIYQVE